MACPSSRRFSAYDREAAAYVQSLGSKAVAVVLLRLYHFRSPEQDSSGDFFMDIKMIDESPLYAVLIYGTAFAFVLVHILINAVMLKDPKAMNRLVAKRGVKTVLSTEDTSWKGTTLALMWIIGACILYGTIISELVFKPLKNFDVYVEPHLAYVCGPILYFVILWIVSRLRL